MARRNIVFSTTRQWNPGDEFILAGVRAILSQTGVEYNCLIYNRHPDLRSPFQDRELLRGIRYPTDLSADPTDGDIQANLKVGFFDNSVRPFGDASYIDLVIVAGTPEWCNGKVVDLYSSVVRHQLPVMILGVGGGCDLYHESFREVIRKASLFVVRDEDTLRASRNQGFSPLLLPCPALFCAPRNRERLRRRIETVGLIYQASVSESVPWNGCSEAAYAYMRALYARLIPFLAAEYGCRFRILCHYIDEVSLAKRDFPEHEVFYSHDSIDYMDFYADCDFIVGPRVHGIAMASSLGAPSVCLVHDSRGSTTLGFKATPLTVGDPMDTALKIVEQATKGLAETSQRLLEHKRESLKQYVALVQQHLTFDKVSYESYWDPSPSFVCAFEQLRPIAHFLASLNFASKAIDTRSDSVAAVVPEIRARLINIELKLNHVLSRTTTKES